MKNDPKNDRENERKLFDKDVAFGGRGWVSRRVFADYLGVSVRTLDRMVADGEVPKPVPMRRMVRFSVRQILEWEGGLVNA